MNKLRIRFAESKQQGSHKVENTCIKDPFSTLWEHFCFNSIPCKPFFLVLMNFRQTRSHMQYQSVLKRINTVN